MGLLSQFRLWRVVRERRKQQAALLKEEQRKKDEAEAEMGRRFEENNMRELARWEAVYGNRETRQSNSGRETEAPESPRKCSSATEVAEAPGDTVEMKVLSQPGHDSTQSTTTTGEKADEKEPKGDATDPPATKGPETTEAAEKGELAHEEGSHPIQGENPPAQTEPMPETPPPVVTPLPFRVPNPAHSPKSSDRHSVQATCEDALSIATRLSRRLSGNTLLKRLSNRTSNLISSSSEEMLVPIRLASPATSVQGIVDGDEEESEFDLQTTAWELDALREQRLPSASGVESRQEETHEHVDFAQEASDVTPKAAVRNDTVQEVPLGNDQLSQNSQEVAQEEHILPRKTYQPGPSHEVTEEEQVPARDGPKFGLHVDSRKQEGLETVPEKRQRPINTAARVLPAGQVFPLSPVTSVPSKSFGDSDKESSTVKKSPSTGSRSQTNTARKTSLTAGAVEKLPSHVSPVVTAHRTNEWAKHLAEADTPEVEPIQPTQDDSARIATQDTEVPAPVRVEELQQTATNTPPPPASERCASLPEEPVTHPIYRSLSSASRYAYRDSSRIYPSSVYADGTATQAAPLLAREPAAPGLARSSQPYPAAARGLHGSPSAFFNNSLASAPIRESEVANFPEMQAAEPPSLMAQRESMVQSRVSSVSLSRDSWLPRSSSRLSLEEGYPWRRESQMSVVPDDDDIPLSQRRAWLQQGGAASHGPGAMRDAYYPANNRPWREPNRTKSQMTMAAWRQALREDLTQSRTPLADVTMARSSMMEQHRKAQLEKQQRKMASEYIDNSIAEKMQRGEMRDLHREALRRMQAAANRKVMGGD